ncbi:rRNA-processing protein fcf2 [Smittium mucronatum]|uniref:rRNA-processing protein fcf2 n=1 Tax=Smittium mucronatum TaxID=133383 RepID=A0A1R0GNW8_9FUNG|nr:rRNA-processing protein fcf2 [Smittium mucronatum]
MSDTLSDLETLFKLARDSLPSENEIPSIPTKSNELSKIKKKLDSGHFKPGEKKSLKALQKPVPVPVLPTTEPSAINAIQSIAKMDNVRPTFKQMKQNREETTGPGWFDMKSPIITESVKQELHVLKLRSVIDPKRFYKRDSKRNEIPAHFQFGRIIEGPADFYSSRMTNRERKSTIVDELLADSQATSYLKKKFKQEQSARESAAFHSRKKKMPKRFKK